MQADTQAATSSANEVLITRTFDAPRALVFRMWTEPKHMARWWGPRGYTTHSIEIDVRVGGAIRLCMRASDGHDIWVNGVIRDLVAPERLVFTAMNEIDRIETTISVTFAEVDGKTRLTMHQTFAKPATEIARGAKQGWNSSFDRLVEYLTEAR